MTAGVDALLVYAALSFLLAGMVKGTVGIGLPMTAIGIMSQFTDPRLAVTLAIFPIVAANIYQTWRAGHALDALRRYGPFAATLAIVLLATAYFVPELPTDVLVIALGIVIVLFAAINLAFTPPYLPAKYDTHGQLVAGFLSGIAGGLTAIWAPPMIAYFLARRIDKDEFVRASGILLLFGSFPLLIGYIYNGLIDAATARFSAMLILPTLAGFAVGELARRRLGSDRFRTVVLVVFLVMGLNLLRRGLF